MLANNHGGSNKELLERMDNALVLSFRINDSPVLIMN